VSTAPSSDTALGDVVEIDDSTVLVLGQPLDIEHDQPDVGIVVIHRAGHTLFVVDTGVTEEFRRAVRGATDRVGPWHRLMVLTTHGHPDHVGNNDLADELGRERGVPVEHFLPARDVPQMLDPAGYWLRSFARIDGVAPMPAPPKLAANKVVSLFQPMHPFGATSRTYEELPLERVTIGSVRMTGWTFADGAVRVLRSQGHCAGHVIVHLRDSRVLHLADEGNGACRAMSDADQLKLQTVLSAVTTLFDEGAATTLTDGHTFRLRHSNDVASHVNGLLDQAMALQAAALAATTGRTSVAPRDFAAVYSRIAGEIGAGGVNPTRCSPG
jgi:glyoxylase-like metal-dependent hydrolase (beta-lactamase superfamily II)